MEKFLTAIVSPLCGKHAFFFSVFFSIIPIAFLNVPLWISLLLILVANLLLFTLPIFGSFVLDCVYIWAFVTTVINPIDIFSIIFFFLFAYRLLCMYANYKLSKSAATNKPNPKQNKKYTPPKSIDNSKYTEEQLNSILGKKINPYTRKPILTVDDLLEFDAETERRLLAKKKAEFESIRNTRS